jgi:hypothetical protein
VEVFELKYSKLTFITLFLMSNIGLATVWYVHPDSALSSIQSGLDSCLSFDTVLVAPGTYVEGLVWPSVDSVLLVSEHGPDSTIIDGADSTQVLVVFGRSGTMKGFTIQHGYTTDYGAGVHLQLTFFTLQDDIIRNNIADSSGGGIFTATAATRIINCTIIDNNAKYGGGVSCWMHGSAELLKCLIAGNTAVNGGGIYSLMALNTHLIDSCEITANTGDGFYCRQYNYDSGTVMINNSNIYDNIGYGARVYYASSPYWINAENNWWGDSAGPYHPDSNPGGLGDSVSDYVDFIPWLTSPVGIFETETGSPKLHDEFLAATIICGPLILPDGKTYRIFDITGRIVAPNCLKPGIYFIEADKTIVQKVIKIK